MTHTGTTDIDPFKRPPHPGYGIPHTPLMVRPAASQKKPGQRVAFIAKQLCFFERDSIIPDLGKPVEVMMTRPLYSYHNERTAPEGFVPQIDDNGKPIYGLNRGSLMAILLRVVTPDHRLIAINGFECSGTMCSTTASGVEQTENRHYTVQELLKKDNRRRYYTLTPGRTGVREASNVNAGYTWKQPFTPLVPTNVYVEANRAEEGGPCRIEGITRLEDASYRRAVRM